MIRPRTTPTDHGGSSLSAPEQSRRRTIIRRRFLIERWRIIASFRLFKGNGLANFEFEFRFGFPRHSPNSAKQIKEMWTDV